MDDALDLSAEVAQLSLIEGERRVSPPEMGSIEGDRGRLYILVEVSAPADSWDVAGERLVATATEAFRDSRGGVTKALNAAAEAANRLLLHENANALPDQYIWAGLNCLVMRGNDLYLGQAGPALTWIVRDGVVKRFPQSFDDLQTGAAPVLTPLGEGYEVQVRLAHFTLKPNDVIALTASHLPTLADDEEIHEALTSGDAAEVIEALADLADGEDFSAMVIRIGEEVGRRTVTAPAPPPIRMTPKLREPEPVRRVRDESDAWWYRDGERPAEGPAEEVEFNEPATPVRPGRYTTARAAAPPIEPEVEPEAPRGRQRTKRLRPVGVEAAARPPRTGRSELTVLEPSHRARTEAQRPMTRSTPQSLATAIDWQVAANAVRVGGAALVSGLAFLIHGINTTLRWSQQTVAPEVARRAGPLLDTAAQASVQAGHKGWKGLRTLWYHLLPGVDAPPPRRASRMGAGTVSFPHDRRLLMAALAILIPIVALALTAIFVWREDGTRISIYDTHTAAAAELLEQAETAPVDDVPLLVQQAREELDAAEEIQPNSVELGQMRQRADLALDRSLGISRPAPTRLAALGESARPANIAVHGDEVYVLDTQEGAVYRLSASQPVDGGLNSLAPILYGGQQLSDGTLSAPQFLTWMPVGNGRANAALIALTETGQVAEYEPASGSVRLLPFMPVDASVVDIEPYEGNLYLLDRANKQIWKYVPAPDGSYSNPPSSWILPETAAELGPPLQMAIDGDIYILQDGGRVSRLNSGKLRPFSLEEIVPPLTNPRGIATEPPESTPLFLFDGERVIQLSKEGQVVGQYLPPPNESWGTIRDLAVDTSAQVAYLLASGGVYRLPYGTAEVAPAEAAPAEVAPAEVAPAE